MVVSNPLELYTVYLGWREYDVIWQACIQFGLAWLPFLALFYENLTKPFESPFGNGTETSFRRVIIELVLMCLVIMICVYPWTNLETRDITYKPYCAKGALTSRPGDSGTTYDDVFNPLLNTEVKVPGLYALVMDWSSGFTNALIAGTIPCVTNINQLMQTISLSHISADLQREVAAFNNTCYLPARTTFDAKQPNPSTYESVMKSVGGPQDLNWMGSHILRSLYYDSIFATEPIKGFSYVEYPSPYVDDAVKKGEMKQPEWGYPSCEQWWTEPNNGLEAKIVNQVNQQTPQNPHLGELPVSDRVSAWINERHGNTHPGVTPNDIIARGILYDSRGNYGGFRLGTSVNTNAGVTGAMAKGFVDIGQTLESITGNSFKRDALSETLPIIQAIAMFLLVLFMPFIQIFGRYRLGICMSLSFLLFGLIFINYIWAMINYLQTALDNSTYDPTLGSYMSEEAPLNNFISILYFGAPLFFMTLMGITGIRIGSAVDNMLDTGSEYSDKVGKDGGRLFSKGIDTAMLFRSPKPR